jgi:hypothetical protein
MGDVDTLVFCDPAQKSPAPEEVVFCDPAQKSMAPEEVVFCNKCGDYLDVTISGSAIPIVGDGYSAGGGKPPYVWHISAGEIDPKTGVIKSLAGACGTGSVSVTDSCGQTASIDIRFPSGQWVLTDTTVFGSCSATYYPITFYEGARKIQITGKIDHAVLWSDGGGGCPLGAWEPTYLSSPYYYPRHPTTGEYWEGGITCNGGTSYGFGTGIFVVYACKEFVYEWRCP